MAKRKPYIFMTQDKLIDLCRYDIGWIEIVGGSDLDAYPDSGFDVQCENDYPMTLSDLKTALTHFEEEKLSFDDFAFDWWCPVTIYFYEDLCLDELLGPDADNICELNLPPLPETDEDMIVTIFIKILLMFAFFYESCISWKYLFSMHSFRFRFLFWCQFVRGFMMPLITCYLVFFF